MFVLDNSVAMRWCFQSAAHPYADSILKRLAGGETAIVPVLWFYEASSVLAREQKVLELLCARNSNPRISAILSMAGRGDSLAALAPWPSVRAALDCFAKPRNDDNGYEHATISALEYAELQRLKAMSRRVRRIEELTEDEIEEMAATRMSPEHDHLNSLLDE